MGNLLSDSSFRDFQEMQQQFKNPGTSSPNSQYRASGSWIMMELVTDLCDDLWSAKAKKYNTNTNAWDDITNGRETDADLPLLVEGGGSAGDIVRAFPSRDTDGNPLWIAVRGGGAGVFILKITASTNISTYTANVIDNRTDATVLESGVTLKALDHDAGTIPTDTILTCSYDSINDFYEPTNYSVFYG